jgi:hypothetical protein
MKNGFDWKRFWFPRDGTFNLSDRGFLSDPEGEWGKYSNPDLVTFGRLAESSCAVLLGEPGGECNIVTLRSPHRSGQGREISKYYDRWRVQPFGPGIAIEQHAAVFAPARADSTVL